MKIELINPDNIVRAVIHVKTVKSLDEISDAMETGDIPIDPANLALHLVTGEVEQYRFESRTRALKWCTEAGLVQVAETDLP